jgi:FAD/FMN-containing dehydrogenase
MEESLRSRLRDELTSLLGPRRFQPGPSHSEHLGTARPESVAEVQQLALLTRDAKVPIVMRGGMSSPFIGAEPTEGLLVFSNNLSEIRGVNARTRVTTVGPGVIWHTLIERLASRGFMLRVYPSSEGFSTIGGFVAQGGIGIGSYQFGDIGRNVAAVRVVDANGELRQIKGKNLRLVVGAEGRTGLVVEVTLRLQELASMTPIVAVFDSFEEAERCLVGVASHVLPIWSVNLMGPGGAGLQSRQWPDMALPEGSHAVIFSFRQRDVDLVVPSLCSNVLAGGGQLVEVRGDNEDWLVQFGSLQAQGTTPIPMQFQVPLGRAAEFVGGIRPELREKLAIEAVVADAGKRLVLRLFFVDRSTTPETNLGAVRALLALAKSVGGVSYTNGAMYLEEAEAIFPNDRLTDIAAFRRTVDPDNRLNPHRIAT